MSWTDLAVRAVGGSVVAASDETFAEKENLVATGAATHAAHTYGHQGQVYDGWETRRRRDGRGAEGDDWAVVRLGIPGEVHQVLVDTAFFDGNHPVSARVEGRWIEGRPSPAEAAADHGWETLVPDTPLSPNMLHAVYVDEPRAVTHVRLVISPDGGVARLRVLGEALPDVRHWRGLSIDLAALENGGQVVDASDRHYSPPENLLLPGSAATMGEGWETRRRRDEGFDWVDVELGVTGTIRRVVVDTTHFVGNAPGTVRLVGVPRGDRAAPGEDRPADAGPPDDAEPAEVELLGEIPVQPDTVHWFGPEDGLDTSASIRRVRLEVRPDGGLARLRLLGEPDPEATVAVGLRRWNALPAVVAESILTAACASTGWAAALTAGRPYADLDTLVAVSDAAVADLDDIALAEALADHPRIGDREAGGPGAGDQPGASDTGRDAEEMASLRERRDQDDVTEARVREQLAEITAARLRELWGR